MKLSEAQVACAVAWWKSVLRQPKFDTLGETRGDPRNSGAAFAELMATAYHRFPGNDVIEQFGEHLASALRDFDEHAYGYASLSVDYGPCGVLHDAWVSAGGEEAGILTFPWKTAMWFRQGGVQVSYGYRGEVQELLPKRPWLRFCSWCARQRQRWYYSPRWRVRRALERRL